jgi:formylglycine-generating enzyme required for sulfatase activity
MKKLLPLLAVLLILSVIAAQCGGPSAGPPSSEQAKPTEVGGPTPTPIPILPTNTPMPPPPTPTPRPTSTPAPTPTGAIAGTAAAPAPTKAPQPEVEMVAIPAGSFTMGSDKDSPDAAPAHQVDLPAYSIDKFEVTNADFAKFVEATGYKTDAEKSGEKGWVAYAEGKDNHPVVKVSWNDAKAFCEWMGKRLPTEAEWEKAARGTDGRTYPWGNDWDPKKANGKEAGLRGTAAAGSFGAGASPYGAMDMAGNVWEWTADWFQPYPGNKTENPYYGEKYKVTRGGAWFEEAAQLTTFNRNATSSTAANDDLGFRCAK